jgi:hypothetical protein
MRYAVSKLRDPLGHSRASARPSSPANLKRERPKSDKRPGVEKRINKKQASDTDKRRGLRDALSQTPIRATLIGSNCCEALGITARGRTPVLDLCRALLKAGHDPRRPLHAYRGDELALRVRSIGEGAKLTIKEDRARPRFVAWEPFPRRVGAWVRERAEGIGSAPDRSDEPSTPPGAAVRTSAKSFPYSHSGPGRRPR